LKTYGGSGPRHRGEWLRETPPCLHVLKCSQYGQMVEVLSNTLGQVQDQAL